MKNKVFIRREDIFVVRTIRFGGFADFGAFSTRFSYARLKTCSASKIDHTI